MFQWTWSISVVLCTIAFLIFLCFKYAHILKPEISSIRSIVAPLYVHCIKVNTCVSASATQMPVLCRTLRCERVYIHMNLLASYVASGVMFMLTSALSQDADVIVHSPVSTFAVVDG